MISLPHSQINLWGRKIKNASHILKFLSQSQINLWGRKITKDHKNSKESSLCDLSASQTKSSSGPLFAFLPPNLVLYFATEKKVSEKLKLFFQQIQLFLCSQLEIEHFFFSLHFRLFCANSVLFW